MQGHTAGKRQRQAANPGSLTPECVSLTTPLSPETEDYFECGLPFGFLVTNLKKRKSSYVQELGRKQLDIGKKPILGSESLAYVKAVGLQTPHCPEWSE